MLTPSPCPAQADGLLWDFLSCAGFQCPLDEDWAWLYLGITLGPWDPVSRWNLFWSFFPSRLLLPTLLLPSEGKSRPLPRLWKESFQNMSGESMSPRWLRKDSQVWEKSMEMLVRAMGLTGMSLSSPFLSDFQANPSFSISV